MHVSVDNGNVMIWTDAGQMLAALIADVPHLQLYYPDGRLAGAVLWRGGHTEFYLADERGALTAAVYLGQPEPIVVDLVTEKRRPVDLSGRN